MDNIIAFISKVEAPYIAENEKAFPDIYTLANYLIDDGKQLKKIYIIYNYYINEPTLLTLYNTLYQGRIIKDGIIYNKVDNQYYINFCNCVMNINEYYFDETIINMYNLDRKLIIQQKKTDTYNMCTIRYNDNDYFNVLVGKINNINNIDIDLDKCEINRGLTLKIENSEIKIGDILFKITKNNELSYDFTKKYFAKIPGAVLIVEDGLAKIHKIIDENCYFSTVYSKDKDTEIVDIIMLNYNIFYTNTEAYVSNNNKNNFTKYMQILQNKASATLPPKFRDDKLLIKNNIYEKTDDKEKSKEEIEKLYSLDKYKKTFIYRGRKDGDVVNSNRFFDEQYLQSEFTDTVDVYPYIDGEIDDKKIIFHGVAESSNKILFLFDSHNKNKILFDIDFYYEKFDTEDKFIENIFPYLPLHTIINRNSNYKFIYKDSAYYITDDNNTNLNEGTKIKDTYLRNTTQDILTNIVDLLICVEDIEIGTKEKSQMERFYKWFFDYDDIIIKKFIIFCCLNCSFTDIADNEQQLLKNIFIEARDDDDDDDENENDVVGAADSFEDDEEEDEEEDEEGIFETFLEGVETLFENYLLIYDIQLK